MIEIIREPKERFETYCPRCGCVFAYELEDVDDDIDMVECPACGKFVEHVAWSRYEIMNTGFSEDTEDAEQDH